MTIDVWCKTDKGLKRESNQDSFLVNQDLGLYVVADGMGGHSGGEVASSLAVQTVEEVVKQPPIPEMKPRDLLNHAYSEASRRIFDRAANERPELLGMGTTMVMIHQTQKSFYVCNVGDSRCYLFRKPYLWQLTEDHSLVNEQVRAGLLNEEQVKNFIGRNVITRSVGYEREVVVDILERPIMKGDLYLMCSDGLSGLVVDKKISEILNKYSPDEVVEKCVEQALLSGGDDNVTVMAVYAH
jgi:PPM family protein phosphatase